jgi:cytosine/adenosine deaminase-related metal-dependent hydrolase
MAFGSDTPVTALDPWGAVAAALFHNNRDFRISARAAFKAHTRGGWRVGGEPNFMAGELRVGAPAHLALWRADELGVQAENDGRSSWTTDARSGSPLLPILEQEAISRGERPQCVATLREGVFLYNTL